MNSMMRTLSEMIVDSTIPVFLAHLQNLVNSEPNDQLRFYGSVGIVLLGYPLLCMSTFRMAHNIETSVEIIADYVFEKIN